MLNYAAPEQFDFNDAGKCDCDAYDTDRDTPKGEMKLTKETDVYSFGCLYYTVSGTSTYCKCWVITHADIFRYLSFPRKR